MFNAATDDLAIKPYILTKVYFNEFVANALRDNTGMIIFDPFRLWRLLEAKNIIS